MSYLHRSTLVAVIMLMAGQGPAQVNQDVKQPNAEKGKVPAALEAVTAKDEGEETKRYSAVGKVVDNKGQAVPGATVYLREQPMGWTEGWTEQSKNIAQVVTDQQGEFKFEAVKLPHSVLFGDAAYPLDIIVVAKGHAVAWKHGFEQDASHSFSFAMQPEAAIRGRVLDREGNPVSKLAVRALQIMGLTDGPRPRRGNRRFFFDTLAATFINLETSHVPLVAHTDADGRFQLANLPTQARVNLLLADDRFLSKEIFAATTDQAQPELFDYVLDKRSGNKTLYRETVYANNLTIALEPGTRVHGKIVFADTGMPAVGARVEVVGSRGSNVEADAEGRFSISRRPLDTCFLNFYPPKDTDYLGDSEAIELTSENRVVEANVKLRRGVPITGKAVEEGTGKGIPGVEIHHYPEVSSESYKLEPTPWITLTKADGTFRIAVAPGKGQLGIPFGPSGYDVRAIEKGRLELDSRYVRDFDIKAGQPVREVTFTLSRGLVLSGRVVDPMHKTAPGVHVRAREMLDTTFTDNDGRFTLSALRANKTYTIELHDVKRSLGTIVAVPFPPNQKKVELEVVLAPTGSVEGRIVDEDKNPLAGASVLKIWFARTHTDANGRFHISGVLPGEEISISALAEGYRMSARTPGRAKLKGESGKTQSIGDITLVKVALVASGVIVDQKGKPIAGVSLSAKSDHPLAPTIFGQPITDSAGRFRFTSLPRGNLEILAVLPWDRKSSHQLPKVKAGDQNVRIVVEAPDGNR